MKRRRAPRRHDVDAARDHDVAARARRAARGPPASSAAFVSQVRRVLGEVAAAAGQEHAAAFQGHGGRDAVGDERRAACYTFCLARDNEELIVVARRRHGAHGFTGDADAVRPPAVRAGDRRPPHMRHNVQHDELGPDDAPGHVITQPDRNVERLY